MNTVKDARQWQSQHGGAAFPATVPLEDNETAVWTGMSLRDWFAGQALAGMLAESGAPVSWQAEVRLRTAAAIAYQMADAMLAERAAEKPAA